MRLARHMDELTEERRDVRPLVDVSRHDDLRLLGPRRRVETLEEPRRRPPVSVRVLHDTSDERRPGALPGEGPSVRELGVLAAFFRAREP